MNYTMLNLSAKAPAEGVKPMEVDPLSLYRTLETVQDGRAKRGVRYSVALILTVLVLSKLVGMKTPEASAQWVRERTEWLKDVLPCPRKRFPCVSTYRNVLRSLDAAHINEVVAQWLVRQRSQKRSEDDAHRQRDPHDASPHLHVALDGKTLRGTQGHLPEDQKKIHQVGLYETQTGILLREHIVADKENELSRVSEFLTPRWIKERIVSADALHTQKQFCLDVVASGGDYVLFAKGNQATLHEDLQLFFREPPPDCRDWRTAQTTNKGHGRLEERALIASTELTDFFATTWTGVSQVFRLRRRVQKPLVCTQQIVYGLTSLSPQKADATRLLELIRDHWAIENRLHYRRDVTLGEDQCQVRKGEAPRVLAVLNSFVLGLFDLLGVSNVSRQMRTFDAHPLQAIRLLLGRP